MHNALTIHTHTYIHTYIQYDTLYMSTNILPICNASYNTNLICDTLCQCFKRLLRLLHCDSLQGWALRISLEVIVLVKIIEA